jgi:hypothetical protein
MSSSVRAVTDELSMPLRTEVERAEPTFQVFPLSLKHHPIFAKQQG